ncbi:hypothetical protein [Streptosporangium sandarakinum]|uniref:Uncharacterized protein n=1 Tax=Streptosporangium sandarakinum TaxID=1260955 RepID=A0A852URB0_9ACTN|nr:hypothetical protein [Streptosporangium sandarakinum]NYF39682.1 hypothetical protein [Streptosporangium sandarakinum]
MSEQDDRRERLEKIAHEHVEHLSGETALGHTDPAARGERVTEETPGATGGGEGQVQGIGDMAGTGTRAPLGDESTGGEAAREAIGAEPGESGEVEDRSTGEASREEVTGDQGGG